MTALERKLLFESAKLVRKLASLNRMNYSQFEKAFKAFEVLDLEKQLTVPKKKKPIR